MGADAMRCDAPREPSASALGKGRYLGGGIDENVLDAATADLLAHLVSMFRSLGSRYLLALVLVMWLAVIVVLYRWRYKAST